VPWALAWAEEQQLIAMEQEARMREMGGDVLTGGAAHEAGEGNTADRVGAALGRDGAAAARPAL